MNDFAFITKSAKFIFYADDATVLFLNTDTEMLAEICNRFFVTSHHANYLINFKEALGNEGILFRARIGFWTTLDKI